MKSFSIFLCATATSLGGCAVTDPVHDGTEDLVGGEPAGDVAPAAGFLGEQQPGGSVRPVCGATLYETSNQVLTAAHCISSLNASARLVVGFGAAKKTIRVGLGGAKALIPSISKTYAVKTAIPHPEKVRTTQDQKRNPSRPSIDGGTDNNWSSYVVPAAEGNRAHDIALLILDEPVPDIPPAQTLTRSLTGGEPLDAIGYGCSVPSTLPSPAGKADTAWLSFYGFRRRGRFQVFRRQGSVVLTDGLDAGFGPGDSGGFIGQINGCGTAPAIAAVENGLPPRTDGTDQVCEKNNKATSTSVAEEQGFLSCAKTRYQEQRTISPPTALCHWAEDFIVALKKLREDAFMTSDNDWQPAADVSRIDFAMLVAKTMQVSYADYWTKPDGKNAAASLHLDDGANAPDEVKANYYYFATAEHFGFVKSPRTTNVIFPTLNITFLEVIAGIATGLKLTPTNGLTALAWYDNETEIRQAAADIEKATDTWTADQLLSALAAATEHELVFTYPRPRTLAAQRTATYAEVAATLYQALRFASNVRPGLTPAAPRIDSPYAVQRRP